MIVDARVESIRDDIKSLTEQIRHWDYEYYNLGNSSVSDDVYDQYYLRLAKLEAAYPELVDKNTPTQRVGGSVVSGYKKIKHLVPMLSIETETNPSEESLNRWIARISEKLGQYTTMVYPEYKYDGVSLSLVYINGKLAHAVTRGDGTVGEDVTENARMIKGVLPNISTCYSRFEVRGEVLMFKETFERLNREQIAANCKPYSNPRNACAGALRQLDPQVTKQKELVFVAYSIPPGGAVWSDYEEWTQEIVLQNLHDLGFITGPIKGFDASSSNPYTAFSDVQMTRENLPFEIDGVVFKAAYVQDQDRLGYRGRELNWAIAFKFPPQEKVTKLLAIDTQVGRTGKLTPVARLEPISVGGVVVSNVTLHNLFDLRNRRVRVGDTVVVRRAGDVIPEIAGRVDYGKSEYRPNFHMPKSCPVCGGIVARDKGTREYKCTNTLGCGQQMIGALLHHVSRKCMNIEGIGEACISALVNSGYVRSLYELYTIHDTDLIACGVAPKNSMTIIKNLCQPRPQLSLQKFIYSLGIPNVGEGTSHALARNLNHIQDLFTVSFGTLMGIKDIGFTTAKSIVAWASNENNQAQVDGVVRWIGVKEWITEKPVTLKEDAPVYVITGSFSDVLGKKGPMGRSLLTKIMSEAGAKVVKQVSKGVTGVIVGESPGGAKIQEAYNLGIPIYTKELLPQLLQQLS